MTMNVLLCFVVALFTVCAYADDAVVDHKVIDLHSLVYGLGVPPTAGVQRYWIDSGSYFIPIGTGSGQVPFPYDHLWEVLIQAEEATVVQPCSYTLGWAQAPSDVRLAGDTSQYRRHSIRSGNIGAVSGIVTAGSSITSAGAYAFIKGTEFPDLGLPRNAATHIYLHVESCFVGRYITRSQFNNWNGGMYLMDWSSSPVGGRSWTKAQTIFANQTGRYGSATNFALSTSAGFDNTIKKPSVGFWYNDFYFDYSFFTTVSQPVLELFSYSLSGKPVTDDSMWEIAFGFCTAGGSGCTLPTSSTVCPSSTTCGYAVNDAIATVWSSPVPTKIYYDIRAARTQGMTDCPSIAVFSVTDQNGHTCAPSTFTRALATEQVVRITTTNQPTGLVIVGPYAKLWNPASRVAPFLFNWRGHHGLTESGCSLDTLPTTLSGAGWIPVSAVGSFNSILCPVAPAPALARFSFHLPAEIATIQNPWIDFYDGGAILNRDNSITLTIAGLPHPLRPSSNGAIAHRMSSSYQVSLGSSTFTTAQTEVTVDVGSGNSIVSSWVQIRQGTLNYCSENPCKNGGMCFNAIYQGYVCVCPSGWTGTNCETDIQACEDTGTFSCMNRGTCVDNLGAPGYTCNCNAGWEGVRCEKPVTACPVFDAAQKPVCLNGGVCKAVPSSRQFTCDCTGTNWGGAFCEIPLSRCLQDTMACGAGVCVPLNTQPQNYRCNCTGTGMTGLHCEIPDVCAVNPCNNGGACVKNDKGVAACMCTAHYFGDMCEFTLAQYKADCRHNVAGCPGNAVCTQNPAGQYRCKCNAYYTGATCDTHVVCSPNPCKNSGSCWVNQSLPDHLKKPLCACTGNYFGDKCEETLADYFSDCRFSPRSCRNGGTCSLVVSTNNAPSRYTCTGCNPGYSGHFCEIATACALNNGGCKNGATCTPVGASKSTCTCTAEWTGTLCDWPVETDLDAKLISIVTSCGFAGSICKNGGECAKLPNGDLTCLCPLASPYTGPTCELPRVCEPNPCSNGGMCSLGSNGAAVCDCTGSFVGDRCQWPLSQYFSFDCNLRPCENGGECSPDGQCVCDTTKWVGRFCELPVVCQSFGCQNGGRCHAVNNVASCLCTGNHFGAKCEFTTETDLADCRTKPCMNGGVCTSTGTAHVCHCGAGGGSHSWTGAQCEISVFCDPNPCRNGGVCSPFGSSFVCQCAGDWIGMTCEDTVASLLDKSLADASAQLPVLVTSAVNASVPNISSVSAQLSAALQTITQMQASVASARASVDSIASSSQSASVRVQAAREVLATKADTTDIQAVINELLVGRGIKTSNAHQLTTFVSILFTALVALLFH